MFLRFFFPRALYEPNTVFSVGFPSDFALGVDQRYLMTERVWVVREPDRIFVIYARCTHLGCTPEWKSTENKFKCPCHGSGYDNEGVNFEGPAPRPMDRALVQLDPTGKIIVDTSRLFVNDPRAGVNHFNDTGAYLNV
jgi:cytochrome b6-f complex iron-sulfur subunit